MKENCLYFQRDFFAELWSLHNETWCDFKIVLEKTKLWNLLIKIDSYTIWFFKCAEIFNLHYTLIDELWESNVKLDMSTLYSFLFALYEDDFNFITLTSFKLVGQAVRDN